MDSVFVSLFAAEDALAFFCRVELSVKAALDAADALFELFFKLVLFEAASFGASSDFFSSKEDAFVAVVFFAAAVFIVSL